MKTTFKWKKTTLLYVEDNAPCKINNILIKENNAIYKVNNDFTKENNVFQKRTQFKAIKSTKNPLDRLLYN